jgi:hypothetical protein
MKLLSKVADLRTGDRTKQRAKVRVVLSEDWHAEEVIEVRET